MPTIEEGLEIMRTFNRKVERLETTRFAQRYADDIPNVTAMFDHVDFIQKEGSSIQIGGFLRSRLDDFDQDEIDAFVLTYRFFVQNNEPTSLRNMSALYAEAWMPEGARDCFEDARQKANEHLDGDSTVMIGDQRLNIRHIVDVFLYGGLAHASPAKARIFESWQNNGITAFLWAEFMGTMLSMLSTLQYVKALHEQLFSTVIIEEAPDDEHQTLPPM